MLVTIAALLIVLWLFGLLMFSVLGGFVHLFLVAAITLLLIRIIKGENPTA